MNFFKRSKASDKAEDVAVAASVQLILDEIMRCTQASNDLLQWS